MKRKILILVLFAFIATGCDIDYHLTIDKDNNYLENFTITAYEDENNTKESLYASYKDEYPIYDDEEFIYYDPTKKNDGYTYYDKSYKDIGNGYKFDYKDKVNFKDVNRLRSWQTAFKTGSTGYIKDEDYYYISVSSPKLFLYNPNLNIINVSISLDSFEVINNNADEIKNNTYIWHIDKNSNKTINLKYKIYKDNDKVPKDDKIQESNENTLINYILLGAVLILFIVGICGLIKYKSINKY